MKITELHLLWYLCCVASLIYIYLLSLGRFEILIPESTNHDRKGEFPKSTNTNLVQETILIHIQPNNHSMLNGHIASPGMQHPGVGEHQQYNIEPIDSKFDASFRQSKVDKYIFYVCLEGTFCGGLTDRLLGISSAYLGSILMKRNFGIISEIPCDFSTFFSPNIVDWEVSKFDYLNMSSVNIVHLSNSGFGKKMQHYIDVYKDRDVIYYKGNTDIVNQLLSNGMINYVPWAKGKRVVEIYKTIMEQLFKHSPYLESRYDEFKSKLTYNASNLVCAHLRMGRSKTLPIDINVTVSRRPHPMAVAKFLKERYSSVPADIFIATDSEDVRAMFKDLFLDRFKEVSGTITHIDQARGRMDCGGMGKAVLDQYILSTCKTLVMSNSGFSRMAAVMRGKDDELYIATSDGQIQPTQRSNPSTTFKIIP